MPSIFNLDLFSAVLLAALLLCVSGAPLGDESMAGASSGDEMEEEKIFSVSDLANLKELIHSIRLHQKAFERESQNIDDYDLKPYDPPIIPEKCNATNFRKLMDEDGVDQITDSVWLSSVQESCLQRLVQGLYIYSVYLKSAEKEYPRSLNFSASQSNISKLINLINILKQKMKNPNRVTGPASSEEQMLKVNSPYAFHRKMKAHNILNHLFDFLKEAKRSICRMEMKTRRNMAAGIRQPSGDIDC
ncbi:interleukin-6-like [Archocentrus centrarchus]|uniref:interleukin-6-like n=1 Tax=Archocentrus centrarchus TaxID=63155 RepID=UPI0011E9E0C6|nr:interleukin-6-like [Archocentrus centrarchus]